MRQARDRQRESIALSGLNPGKSIANIFRHQSSSKRGHELPPLLNDNKVFLTDDTDKAELFRAFFAKRLNTESEPVPFLRSLSVYTNEARFLPPSTEELPTPSVSEVLFSEGIVRRELEALNESKSPGSDEIPPKLLKELASELSVPLSMLFQASFDTGTLPIDWKLAHITPLYKGGSRASTTNYRPISLTSSLPLVDTHTPRDRSYVTRNSSVVIPPPLCTTSTRSLFFASKYAYLWNSLPPEIKSSPNLLVFKSKLRKHLSPESIKALLTVSFPNTQRLDFEKGPPGTTIFAVLYVFSLISTSSGRSTLAAEPSVFAAYYWFGHSSLPHSSAGLNAGCDQSISEISEMASRMRQARDRQRESIALSGSNPGKSIANIFRHQSSSKRGHELPPLLNDNKVFLTDDTDKAELFRAFFAKRLNTESEPVPFLRSLSEKLAEILSAESTDRLHRSDGVCGR
ncbi:hypothetical protein SprV_0301029700 [Sparganum proliferum]